MKMDGLQSSQCGIEIVRKIGFVDSNVSQKKGRTNNYERWLNQNQDR